MRNRLLLAGLMLVFTAAFAAAQPKVEAGPMKRTAANDPKGMFNSYCAVCHGTDGKGMGPAAAALKKAPADLTMISARNGGQFPDTKVKRYIEGVDDLAAHGSRDMPMWGQLFKDLDRDTAAIRVQGLTDYLKSLQKK